MRVAVGIFHRQLDGVATTRIRSTTVCFRIGRVGSIASAFRAFRQRVGQAAVFIDRHRSLARQRFGAHQLHFAVRSEQCIRRHRHLLIDGTFIRMTGGKVRLVHGHVAHNQFRRAGLIDGHGHVGRMRIAVSIRRHQRKAVRRSFRRIGIGRIGIAVVIIDDHRTVGQMIHAALIGSHALNRHCTGRSCTVSPERYFKTLRRALTFRQVDTSRRIYRRHVVLYHHRDHAATGGTISIRHGYRKIMGNGVVRRSILFVLLRRTRKMIGIIQASGRGVEARYFQITFISGHLCSGEGTIFKHGHTADGDGGHAIGSINIHEAVRQKLISIWIRAACKVGLLHSEHVTIRNYTGGRIIVRIVGIVYDRRIVNAARIARSNGHAIVNIHIISAGGRTIGFGIHITAGPADIEAAKTVETIKQVCVYIIMESVAITLITCVTGRTGSRHEIRLVHGREEVFTGNFSAIHREGRHILAGIGRIKVFELKGTAILKGDDKIIAVTGQRSFIGGKFKNKTGIGSTDNILGSTRSRLGKSYVSHDNLLKSIKKRNKKGENS